MTRCRDVTQETVCSSDSRGQRRYRVAVLPVAKRPPKGGYKKPHLCPVTFRARADAPPLTTADLLAEAEEWTS
jgi:hypothetical protein